ncbi:hypothetical protein CQA70_29610, partial [Klebsiella pneumoniae]
YILNDAADEVLFFDQTFLPLVAQLLPQLPTVKHNPRLSVDHLRYILNDAADEVLFFDQTFLPLVAQLLPQLPTVKH